MAEYLDIHMYYGRWHAYIVRFLRTEIVKSSKWPSISAAISHFMVLFNLEININTKPTKTYIRQSKFKSRRR